MTSPSATDIHLNLANTGNTEFTVVYAQAAPSVVFPFVSTSISDLRFDGAAGVRAASYDDPMMGGATVTTLSRMIGKRVVVKFSTGAKHDKIETASGELLQMDKSVTVLSTDAGVLALKSENIVSAVGSDLTGKPALNLQLDSPGKPLIVRGRDAQLSYTVQHAVLLEPNQDAWDGSCRARLSTHATVYNGYRWPLTVNRMTLTEFEPRTGEKARGEYRMMVTTAASPPPDDSASSGVGQSAQSGSVQVPGSSPITLDNTLCPTVVTVGDTRLADARWHTLGTADPTDTDTDKEAIPLDFVVRLNRDPAATEFLLSGAASVQLDMDPAPGDDHLSPSSLPRGFYYNAWDSENATRMYYRLGQTMLVTLDACVSDEMRAAENHDTKSNSHTVSRRLEFSNRTPYNVRCKVYLRTRSYNRTLTALAVKSSDAAARVKLDDRFVPETKDESDRRDTRTLLVVVPPNTDKFKVELGAQYYVRQ